MRRGEVRWSVVPGRSGKAKKRPLLVVSEDAFNENQGYDKVLVVALGSGRRMGGPYLWEVEMSPLAKGSTMDVVRCQEIFTLRKAHVGELFATLSPEDLERVDRALALVLGLTAPPRAH